MNHKTETAWRKWQTLAERGYGTRTVDTPGRMAKVDARIRKAKAEYERLLAVEKTGVK
jgi:hypothetical protein